MDIILYKGLPQMCAMKSIYSWVSLFRHSQKKRHIRSANTGYEYFNSIYKRKEQI